MYRMLLANPSIPVLFLCINATQDSLFLLRLARAAPSPSLSPGPQTLTMHSRRDSKPPTRV